MTAISRTLGKGIALALDVALALPSPAPAVAAAPPYSKASKALVCAQALSATSLSAEHGFNPSSHQKFIHPTKRHSVASKTAPLPSDPYAEIKAELGKLIDQNDWVGLLNQMKALIAAPDRERVGIALEILAGEKRPGRKETVGQALEKLPRLEDRQSPSVWPHATTGIRLVRDAYFGLFFEGASIPLVTPDAFRAGSGDAWVWIRAVLNELAEGPPVSIGKLIRAHQALEMAMADLERIPHGRSNSQYAAAEGLVRVWDRLLVRLMDETRDKQAEQALGVMQAAWASLLWTEPLASDAWGAGDHIDRLRRRLTEGPPFQEADFDIAAAIMRLFPSCFSADQKEYVALGQAEARRARPPEDPLVAWINSRVAGRHADEDFEALIAGLKALGKVDDPELFNEALDHGLAAVLRWRFKSETQEKDVQLEIMHSLDDGFQRGLWRRPPAETINRLLGGDPEFAAFYEVMAQTTRLVAESRFGKTLSFAEQIIDLMTLKLWTTDQGNRYRQWLADALRFAVARLPPGLLLTALENRKEHPPIPRGPAGQARLIDREFLEAAGSMDWGSDGLTEEMRLRAAAKWKEWGHGSLPPALAGRQAAQTCDLASFARTYGGSSDFSSVEAQIQRLNVSASTPLFFELAKVGGLSRVIARAVDFDVVKQVIEDWWEHYGRDWDRAMRLAGDLSQRDALADGAKREAKALLVRKKLAPLKEFGGPPLRPGRVTLQEKSQWLGRQTLAHYINNAKVALAGLEDAAYLAPEELRERASIMAESLEQNGAALRAIINAEAPAWQDQSGLVDGDALRRRQNKPLAGSIFDEPLSEWLSDHPRAYRLYTVFGAAFVEIVFPLVASHPGRLWSTAMVFALAHVAVKWAWLAHEGRLPKGRQAILREVAKEAWAFGLRTALLVGFALPFMKMGNWGSAALTSYGLHAGWNTLALAMQARGAPRWLVPAGSVAGSAAPFDPGRLVTDLDRRLKLILGSEVVQRARQGEKLIRLLPLVPRQSKRLRNLKLASHVALRLLQDAQLLGPALGEMKLRQIDGDLRFSDVSLEIEQELAELERAMGANPSSWRTKFQNLVREMIGPENERSAAPLNAAYQLLSDLRAERAKALGGRLAFSHATAASGRAAALAGQIADWFLQPSTDRLRVRSDASLAEQFNVPAMRVSRVRGLVAERLLRRNLAPIPRKRDGLKIIRQWVTLQSAGEVFVEQMAADTGLSAGLILKHWRAIEFERSHLGLPTIRLRSADVRIARRLMRVSA